MADTQSAVVKSGYGEAPHVVSDDSSMQEAEEAILKMLVPETETPESEEAEPTEEEESQPEEEDESLEEEPEESEELDDEGADNRAEEGEDLYAVTVNGEEHTVPLDELLKGYSRQSDYTKKTQEISEERKKVATLEGNYNSEIGQIQAERTHYVQALQSLIETSMGALDEYSNINWEELKRDDPIEFVTKKEEWREKQDKIQGLQKEQAEAFQRQEYENKIAHKKLVATEHAALGEKLPEWNKSKEERRKIAGQVRDYALSQGFDLEEVKGLVDHRSILVLLKAKKYDDMSNSDVRAKKLKNKPRVIRAGSGTSRSQESRSQRKTKMKRLQQSGHVDDAASLLEDMFNS